MTLARLAVEQGDLVLAEKTLRSVLDADPENSDAAHLLESLIEAPTQPEGSGRTEDSADAKVKALQEWLDAAKLASERLDS